MRRNPLRAAEIRQSDFSEARQPSRQASASTLTVFLVSPSRRRGTRFRKGGDASNPFKAALQAFGVTWERKTKPAEKVPA